MTHTMATSAAPSAPSASTTTTPTLRDRGAGGACPRGDHGAGPHRDGRRQRRGRGVDVCGRRAELRHHVALDAAAAHPGAHRQPGDGRAPRGRLRSRARPPHLRAFRQRLGTLRGRRPVRSQLPDDCHGIHRHRARRRVLRCSLVDRGTACGNPARRHHGHRAFRNVGAPDVRDPLRQPAGDPAHVSLPSAARRRHQLRPPWDPGRIQVRRRAPHRRDRRDHRDAVAAVLSTVERRRQAHHATVDSLRACGHGDRRYGRGHRRGMHHDRGGVCVRRHAPARCIHQRSRSGARPQEPRRTGGGRGVRRAAHRCVGGWSERRDSRRPRTRSATRSASGTRCTGRGARPSRSTPCSRCS